MAALEERAALTGEPRTATIIAVDAASLGPRFWGVGGLSAGGSSRLLSVSWRLVAPCGS